MGLGFLLPHGEWAGFVSEPCKGACLLAHAGVVSLPSRAGTGRYNQSSMALVPGPPALCVGSWLSFGLALASSLLWQAIFFLPSSFARSQSHMVMDDNSGFTFCYLWRQHRNPSSVIPADDQSMA